MREQPKKETDMEEFTKYTVANLESQFANLKTVVSNVRQTLTNYYTRKLEDIQCDSKTRILIHRKIMSDKQKKKPKFKDEEDMGKTLLTQRLLKSVHTDEERELFRIYQRQFKEIMNYKTKTKLEEKLTKSRKIKALLIAIIEGKEDPTSGNKKIYDMCEQFKRKLPRKFTQALNVTPKRAL